MVHTRWISSIAAILAVGLWTPATPGQGTAAQPPSSAYEAASAVENALVDAIARAEKSVVAIARVRRARPGEVLNLEHRPDPFGGARVLASPAIKPTHPDYVPNDYATGVIVDRQGLVLTAYHVLGEESDYYVTTYDRRVYRARVVGADPRSDLAVLAPEEDAIPRGTAVEFPSIPMGDAAGLRKGHFVVALGNPFAIARDGQASASRGIVANLNRKAPPTSDDADSGKPTIHHFGTLIQTDAKLNQGTSGGPLLNLKGEMIGLLTAIPTVAGYDEQAGYAMPVDATFRRALEALKQGREVEYGLLGVRLKASSGSFAADSPGARVEEVQPGLPAARQGIRAGDFIVAVNGAPIRDSDSLILEVSKTPLESPARLTVQRGTAKLELDVELTKYRVRGKRVVTALPPSWRGMRVDYFTAVFDSQSPGTGSRIPDAVVVTDVERGTPAWEAGIRQGMLVSQVERAIVGTPKRFREAVSTRAGPVQLRVAEEKGELPSRTVMVPGA